MNCIDIKMHGTTIKKKRLKFRFKFEGRNWNTGQYHIFMGEKLGREGDILYVARKQETKILRVKS